MRAASEIRAVRVAPQEKGLELHIELAPGRFREHLARRRAITGRTSCGLCGVETVEQLPQAEKLAPAAPIAPRAVFRGARQSRPQPEAQRPDPRRPWRRLLHARRRDPGAARGCRAPQCPRQADRRPDPRGRVAARGVCCRHQPRLVRNGRKDRDFRRARARRHFGADYFCRRTRAGIGPDARGDRPRRRHDGFFRRFRQPDGRRTGGRRVMNQDSQTIRSRRQQGQAAAHGGGNRRFFPRLSA